MKKAVLIYTLFSTLALGLAPAAQSEGIQEVELLQGWRDTSGDVIAALSIKLDHNWKTYWRAPGDAGFPPLFDFSQSKNVAAIDVIWPSPEQIGNSGFETLGYTKQLVLPIRVTPANDAPVTLELSANIGVCKDICVPYDFVVSQPLRPKNKRDPRIIAALANAPYAPKDFSLDEISCDFEKVKDGISVSAKARVPSQGGWEWFVIEYTSPDAWVDMAKPMRHGDILSTSAIIKNTSNAPVLMQRKKLRLSIIGPSRTIEQIGCS